MKKKYKKLTFEYSFRFQKFQYSRSDIENLFFRYFRNTDFCSLQKEQIFPFGSPNFKVENLRLLIKTFANFKVLNKILYEFVFIWAFLKTSKIWKHASKNLLKFSLPYIFSSNIFKMNFFIFFSADC